MFITSVYYQLNDPVHTRCREKHVNALNTWKNVDSGESSQGDNINQATEDDDGEEMDYEIAEEIDIPVNPCCICSIKSYIEGDPNDSTKNPTITLTENGVANCNEWAKSRNMDLTFQVFIWIRIDCKI